MVWIKEDKRGHVDLVDLEKKLKVCNVFVCAIISLPPSSLSLSSLPPSLPFPTGAQYC